MEINDTYNLQSKIDRADVLLESKKNILPVNKEHIKKFLISSEASETLGYHRKLKYRVILRQIAEISKKDFKAMERADIEEIMAELNKRNYSQWTMKDFRVCLKRFFQYLYGLAWGEHPPVVKWLKSNFKNGSNHNTPDIFTKEEVHQILNSTTNIRDKAFFSMLYDAQSREGEMLGMRLRDIEFKPDGVWITLRSLKSGEQSIKLYESASLLSGWLQIHPFYPNDLDKPLWVSLRQPFNQMRYSIINRKFRLLCEVTGINKRHKKVCMHMFRKSRTSHLLKDGLSSEFVKRRGRWSPGSKVMETTYLGVSQQDVADQMDRLKGIKNDKTIQTEKIVLCSRCHIPLGDGLFCSNCGMPKDIKSDNEAESQLLNALSPEMRSEIVKSIIIQVKKELEGH